MPQQQMVIDASAEKVFAYVADISKHGEWGQPSQKLQVEKTSDGPVGQGATFKSVGHQFGRQDDTVTITEYQPNSRVAYESQGKAGHLRHWFEITPAGSGVEVQKGFEILKAGFPFALFAPVVKAFVAPGALRGDLLRIKEKLEAS